MQINIALSKKEKLHYFFYLLGLLLVTILIISVITLRNFNSPFLNSKLDDVSKLNEKSKFDAAQKDYLKNMDSTFAKISKLDPDHYNQLDEFDITEDIKKIDNALTTFSDPRKEAYPIIADYYRMYLSDKENFRLTQKNIENLKLMYDDCMTNEKIR